MKYITTRSVAPEVGFTSVIKKGLGADNGLFLSDDFSSFTAEQINKFADQSYSNSAAAIFSLFADEWPKIQCGTSPKKALNHTLSHNKDDLLELVKQTYSSFQSPEEVTPLEKYADKKYLLNAFQGVTLSFKDVAMQLLANWMSPLLQDTDKSALVIGATSGDTGAAAVDAFANKSGVTLVILHPYGRVSLAQRKQMTTSGANNVHNIAVEGTFDDCQRIVKAMFSDATLLSQFNISGINSINFARVMAQSVYYAVASSKLFKQNNNLTDFIVPSGNFGNAFSAYMARMMGFPVGRIILATNENDILYRIWRSGIIKPQTPRATLSPAMDIQVASNFERYLFVASGRDANAVKTIMSKLSEKGAVTLSDKILKNLRKDFVAFRASDDETMKAIERFYQQYSIIIDPHTATGYVASQKLAEELDQEQQQNNQVIVATAHPAKFSDTVYQAIGIEPVMPSRLQQKFAAKEEFTILPAQLSVIRDHITSIS